MITGNDEISIAALKDIEDGLKIREVADKYKISMDQAKRLSRFLTMTSILENNISPSNYIKLFQVGLKSLTLTRMVKDRDYEGIEEILNSVRENVTRSELETAIVAWKEKKERINIFQTEVQNKIKSIKLKIQSLKDIEKEYKDKLNQINNSLKMFSKYTDDEKEFLLEHVGLFNGSLVILKRPDYNWFNSMKKRETIIYDQDEFVYLIPNIDVLIKEYNRRKKNKNPILWEEKCEEYERMKADSSYSGYPFPATPNFERPISLVDVDYLGSIEGIQEQRLDLEKEIIDLNEKFDELKKQKVQTFIEKIEKSNTLSDRELKKHEKLQNKVTQWLYEKGYAAITDFRLPNQSIVDVIGINAEDKVVIVEVKVSQSDYANDMKWHKYLRYCDDFYFCTDDYYTDNKNEFANPEDFGLIMERNKYIVEKRLADNVRNMIKVSRSDLRFQIMRAMSKKNIFGY